MEYTEPDSRWEMYNVSSLEEYVDKFVIKGKFHKLVPTDIRNAWKTVEYILAHSYYHWPMYDEGFKKALLIIEMAVKLKAKSLGVDLKTKINKKGKVFDKKLFEIIKEVFSGEHYESLKLDIDRARSIRSGQMHPSNHSYMGAAGNISGNLKLFVNILNAIFKDENWHISNLETNKILVEKLKNFTKSLLVYESNKPSILLYGIIGFKVLGNQLVLACNPIRTDISKIISEDYYTNAIILLLRNYEINNSEIIGQSSEKGSIKLFRTDKSENLDTLNNYLQQIESCDEADYKRYMQILQNDTAWGVENAEYENLNNQIIK